MRENSVFKGRFYTHFTHFYNDLSGTVKKSRTNERVLEVISRIKTCKMAMDSGIRRTPTQYYWSTKYDLMHIVSEIISYLKKKPLMILLFGYFLKNNVLIYFWSHKQIGHGARDKMLYR